MQIGHWLASVDKAERRLLFITNLFKTSIWDSFLPIKCMVVVVVVSGGQAGFSRKITYITGTMVGLRPIKLHGWSGNSITQLSHKVDDLPSPQFQLPIPQVCTTLCVFGDGGCSLVVTWPDVPVDPRVALSGFHGSGVFALRSHSTGTNSTDRARGHSAPPGRRGQPCEQPPPARQKPARTLKPQPTLLASPAPGPHLR